MLHRRAAKGCTVVPYVFPVAAATLLIVVSVIDYEWLFRHSPGADPSSPSEGVPFLDAGWWDAADIPLLPLHLALIIGLAENSDPFGRWLNKLTKT